MKDSKTILEMFGRNKKIFVPNYQRAYSWDTSENSEKIGQVNVFLDDLEKHIESGTESPYYFGHFLFEKLDKENEFAVVDGQQRMTTIVIFVSALFQRLKQIHYAKEIADLKDDKIDVYKCIFKFETVEYDQTTFRDYIIDNPNQTVNTDLLQTTSAKRFVSAYQFFAKALANKTEKEILELLSTVTNASCSTYAVESESDAVQMFIFENNRGKKPSDLEVIKAKFMFHIHLYSPNEDERKELIKNVKDRFKTIYHSIAEIEYSIPEDDILRYVVRVFFNQLWETDAKGKIESKLTPDQQSLKFIKDFSFQLEKCFQYLVIFFTKDQKSFPIHSLISLGRIGIAFPFILKAYDFNLSLNEKEKLCQVLETILLRHRIVGTRAELVSRLNESYEKFTKENPSIEGIIDRINELKESKDSWLGYWNTDNVKRGFEYRLNSNLAKFLLWKYENYLRNKGKNGYEFMKYTGIVDPELEHIAPQTKTSEDVASGYPDYTDEFKEQYLNCLGNLLLISKSHNSSIGNKPFKVKRESYNDSPLLQQREVFAQTEGERKWSISLIEERRDKIIAYLMTIL